MAEQFWTVYERVDGDLIAGEYAYTTETEWFEDDDEPTELIERKYVLIEERRIVVPEPRYCTFDVDDDWCESDDGIAWVKDGDTFVPRCAQHQEAI